MLHRGAQYFFYVIVLTVFTFTFEFCERDPCDSPTITKHYSIPTWSPDGNTVAVIENSSVNCSELIPKPIHLSFIRAYDGLLTQSNVYVPTSNQYGFTPDNKYIYTINQYQSGLDFFEFDGTKALTQNSDNPVGSLIDSLWNITSVAFSPFDKSFIVIKNHLSIPTGKIELHSYGALPWQTTSIIIDSVIAKNLVRSVVWVNKTTFVLRMFAGNIYVMNSYGVVISSFSIPDSNRSIGYYSHLRLKAASNLHRIYAISDKGLEMIDLNINIVKTILDGEIRDFDVSPDEQHIAFQTASNDIWTADMDGNPEHRVLPNSREPRFSPEGNRIAGIRALSANEDQLVIVRVSQ